MGRMVAANDCTMTAEKAASPTKEGDPKREKARALYCEEGLGATDIAQRLVMKVKTVRGWINRYGWAAKRSVVSDHMMTAAKRTATEIGEAMAQEAARWSGQSVRDAKRLREKAMGFLDADGVTRELEIDEVKSVVATMSQIDQMARKALGLDEKVNAQPGTLVNISLGSATTGGPIGQGVSAAPIDITSSESESESDTTSPDE